MVAMMGLPSFENTMLRKMWIAVNGEHLLINIGRPNHVSHTIDVRRVDRVSLHMPGVVGTEQHRHQPEEFPTATSSPSSPCVVASMRNNGAHDLSQSAGKNEVWASCVLAAKFVHVV